MEHKVKSFRESFIFGLGTLLVDKALATKGFFEALSLHTWIKLAGESVDPKLFAGSFFLFGGVATDMAIGKTVEKGVSDLFTRGSSNEEASLSRQLDVVTAKRIGKICRLCLDAAVPLAAMELILRSISN